MEKNVALLFNDADGCYDRIPPTLAEVALRRLWCPTSIAKVHTKAQRSMRHHVKTNTGVLEGYIKYNKTTKRKIKNGIIILLTGLIGGVGQGGGASPIIWMAILIMMLKAYKKTQEGAIIMDYIKNTAIYMFIISYVDDNSIVMHFPIQTTVKEMLEIMREITIMHWHQEGEWGHMKLTTK